MASVDDDAEETVDRCRVAKAAFGHEGLEGDLLWVLDEPVDLAAYLSAHKVEPLELNSKGVRGLEDGEALRGVHQLLALLALVLILPREELWRGEHLQRPLEGLTPLEIQAQVQERVKNVRLVMAHVTLNLALKVPAKDLVY